ncbi:MAG: TolC family protein [Bacteroidales bacterium]
MKTLQIFHTNSSPTPGTLAHFSRPLGTLAHSRHSRHSRHFRHFRHLLFLLLLPTLAHSQTTLTLKQCYESAYTATPLSAEKQTYSGIWQLKDKNLVKGWLPTLDASGTFVYNSEVVDMSGMLGALPVPGIADAIQPLPHEQYKLTLDINQPIYDGGAIRGARAAEKAGMLVNEKQTEVDLYQLRGQINTYFFNIMLLDKQKILLEDFHKLISKRIESVNSALANGVLLKSDLDVLLAERIKLEQQITENHIRKTSLLKILSGLTAIAMDDSTRLIIPEAANELTGELARPELQLLDLRKEQLDASRQMISSKRMPKAFAFATLGYGNPPGNNFFRDEFDTYYTVGAGLKWNIFDWSKARNEKQVVTLQQSLIDSRKTDLTDNLKRLLDSKSAEVATLESMLQTDAELIAIRKRISERAASQYENGTLTATEYMNELNAERQAILNAEIHKINLAMARVEYLNISGKEID